MKFYVLFQIMPTTTYSWYIIVLLTDPQPSGEDGWVLMKDVVFYSHRQLCIDLARLYLATGEYSVPDGAQLKIILEQKTTD